MAVVVAAELKEVGVPLWLLREYLEDLGGIAQGEQSVLGEGWKASFEKAPPFQIGSLAVGRVKLALEGEEKALERLLPRLEMKLLRGGG